MMMLFTDGASRGNPGKSAIAFLALKDGNLTREYSEFIGEATNNVAEYKAIIKAFEYAIEQKEKKVTVTSDSELVIMQLKGKYKVKKKHLVVFYNKIKALEGEFSEVHYKNVPREDKNISRCDKLVNDVLDLGK